MNDDLLTADPVVSDLFDLAAAYAAEARTAGSNVALRAYLEGKAFAYEHAARMMNGTAGQ